MSKRSLSDTVLSLDMYECFMTAKYLCACLKRYHANLSLKQGYINVETCVESIDFQLLSVKSH